MKLKPTQKKLISRYRGLCGRCLRRKATGVHEIVPRSAGGTLTENNQIPLCDECHREIQADWRKWTNRLYLDQQRARKLFKMEVT